MFSIMKIIYSQSLNEFILINNFYLVHDFSILRLGCMAKSNYDNPKQLPFNIKLLII